MKITIEFKPPAEPPEPLTRIVVLHGRIKSYLSTGVYTGEYVEDGDSYIPWYNVRGWAEFPEIQEAP